MFDHRQFRDLVIKPILGKLNLYSFDIEELLIFTMANESNGGTYLRQCKGPALGVYQMEPNTHFDIWQNYIRLNLKLGMALAYHLNAHQSNDYERLITDLSYATVMARIHYLRVKAPVPNKEDTPAIYAYYKQYYNTPAGKANQQNSIAKYESFLLGGPVPKPKAKEKADAI